jgi:hypothetical protein
MATSYWNIFGKGGSRLLIKPVLDLQLRYTPKFSYVIRHKDRILCYGMGGDE